MNCIDSLLNRVVCSAAIALSAMISPSPSLAAENKVSDRSWEITRDRKQTGQLGSREALDRGLAWLARNQGAKGNWGSDDLGLVALGALAFLSAGHTPGRGEYGKVVDRALDYIVRNAETEQRHQRRKIDPAIAPPIGLLNISGRRAESDNRNPQFDMYNHGLATFVLGQAYGMTRDRRLRPVLKNALNLIVQTQCDDGSWRYVAKKTARAESKSQPARGHDLSLIVMQVKAVRSARDSGFHVPKNVVRNALVAVRRHYRPRNVPRGASEDLQKKYPGQFTYTPTGDGRTVAMAAAGVVCLQEFGYHNDWRVEKNMQVIRAAVSAHRRTVESWRKSSEGRGEGDLPFEAYALYYIGQALYQSGATHLGDQTAERKDDYWHNDYPLLRDYLVYSQITRESHAGPHGSWNADRRVSGKPGKMFSTAVACFVLAIPNRYLPILQERSRD